MYAKGWKRAKRDRYIPCNVTWYQSPGYVEKQ